MLGLGACLVLRARGADTWAAFALAAALLHTLNHAIFKALLFLGAGAFETCGRLARARPARRAAAADAVDRRRVPRRRAGDRRRAAPERVRLGVADAAGAAARPAPTAGVGDGLAGAVALAALAATAALAVFCFVKVVGLVLLGPPRRPTVAAAARGAASPMRAALVAARRRLRRARRRARAARSGRSSGSRRGRRRAPTSRRAAPARHRRRCRRSGSPSRSPRLPSVLARRCAGSRVAAPAPTWACGQLVEPQLGWTSAGFTKPLRLVLEVGPASRARDRRATRAAASCRRSPTAAGCRSSIDERVYRPAVRGALVAARRRRAGCRAAASAPTSPT